MQNNPQAAHMRIAINAVSQIAELFDAILKIGPQDYAALRAFALRGRQLSNATAAVLSDGLPPIVKTEATARVTAQ